MLQRIFALTLLSTTLAMANVDVRTNIAGVYHEGQNELIGSFTLAVNGNDFEAASPTTPIYIRFRIVRANGWAKTRVDLRTGSLKNVPINLALSVDGQAIMNPGLPTNAIQLVRLVQGERDGWIRVNYPSSSWLQVAGFPAPPDNNNVVSMSLGLDALSSVRPGASTVTQGNEFDDGSGLANTELCTDYSNTPTFTPGDLDFLDFIAFDDETTGVEDGIPNPGNNAGVTFSNDNQIARGELYVARFEYHVTKDEFDGPGHDLQLNRLNSVDVWNWCGPIDPVFFTNSGDFDWEPGTTLYLCLLPFNPAYISEGLPDGFGLDEPAYLADSDIQVSSPESQSWHVEKIYRSGFFVGYAMNLQAGIVPPAGRVDIQGLQSCMSNDYQKADLKLAAYAYVLNDFVTDGLQIPLGPRIRITADMEESEATYYRQVIPFTAYDRSSWNFMTKIVNQSDETAIATAILFNRHGLTLRVHGVQLIEPRGSLTISVPELFGNEAKGVLAWMEILSDQPLSTSGIIDDAVNDSFDIFAGVKDFRDVLYLPHIPSLPDIWETKTYVLSSELESDTQFFLQRPNEAPTQIRAILIPGSTAVLSESDYLTGTGRATWLQLNATETAGSGLAIFNKKGASGQVATMPLNLKPSNAWHFDHVGRRDNGWWNGLILCNPNFSSTLVRIYGLDDNSVPLAEAEIEIASQSRIADFVRSFVESTADPISRLRIESDVDIVAFLLSGIDDNDQLTAITGNLPESSDLTLTHIPQSLDGWVGLSLVNPRSQRAAISMRAYTASGQASPDIFLDVQAQGKRVFLLSDVLENAHLYTHLSVTSNVSIRGFALIGNTSHTQLATVNLEPVQVRQ